MKKVTLLFTVLAVFFSLNAFAGNFTGTWQGTGSYHIHSGEVRDCWMTITFSQTDKNFTISKGILRCGNYNEWNPKTFEIRGEDLWLNGKAMARLSNNSFSATTGYYTYSEDFVFELKDNGVMTYRQVNTSYSSDDKDVISIELQKT